MVSGFYCVEEVLYLLGEFLKIMVWYVIQIVLIKEWVFFLLNRVEMVLCYWMGFCYSVVCGLRLMLFIVD